MLSWFFPQSSSNTIAPAERTVGETILRGDIVLYRDVAYYADKPVGTFIDLYNDPNRIGASFYRRFRASRYLVTKAPWYTTVLRKPTPEEMADDEKMATLGRAYQERQEEAKHETEKYFKKFVDKVIMGD